MIYKFLDTVFRRRYDDDRYVPNIFHTLLGVLYMLSGTAIALEEGWQYVILGSSLFLMGIALSGAVIYSITYESPIEYLEWLNKVADTIGKTNRPELLHVLGLESLPEKVKIREVEDVGQGFESEKLVDIEISPLIMANIANAVLIGRHSFSENELVNKMSLTSAPKFRHIKSVFEKNKYIRLNNTRYRNLGFSMTKKGTQVLFGYLDNISKQIYLEKNNERQR